MDKLRYLENVFKVINLMLHFFIWLTSQYNSPVSNWLMRRAAGVMNTGQSPRLLQVSLGLRSGTV